jgi:uncharacterized LabA/DUF88 family protein
MDFLGLKLKSYGIDKDKFGKIYCFVDFGNVNYWYERDQRDHKGSVLAEGYKLVVDIEKLYHFLNLFSNHSRFYFGLDPKRPKSIKIISKARNCFQKTITKPIQKIKHYLDNDELKGNTRNLNEDTQGKYVYIPKCNFDVEICVDAVRFIDQYDSFCLLSSDADFAYLTEYLRRKKKKIILISSGYVSHWLKDKVDLNINSQILKKEITYIKQKPRL